MAGLTDRLGLNLVQQKALFRLRARLTWRQYVSEPGRIVGAIILGIFVLPLFLGAAVGTTIGYLRLPTPWPAQLLGGVVVLLWGIWLLAPILLFSLNEGMDLTRLLVYPVTRRDLAVSFVLGTLFDFPTYLMLPLFLAILIGWGISPALLILPLALPLLYGHMVLTSQLVVTIAGGILRSRRFRDISIILLSLLGTSCYFLQNGFEQLLRRTSINPDQLATWRPLDVLQWLPPGAVARAIEQASLGEWSRSLLWLGYAALWLLLIAWAWSRLLLRWLTGEGFLINLTPRAEKEKQAASRPVARGWVWLPADVGDLMMKELKSLWRIPQRRVGLIQTLILPFIMGGGFLASGSSLIGESGRWLSLALPAYSLFMFWIMGQNMLGMEGVGLAQLLTTPVPRQRIFLAKGAALLLVMGGVLLGMMALLLIFTREALLVPAFFTALIIGLSSLAVSALLSVYFPMPVNLESTSRRGVRVTGGSCLTGIVAAFVAPIVHFVAALPAVLPLVLGLILERPWVSWLGLPLALAYGGLVFWWGTRYAGSALTKREPEVLAATRLPEQDEST